MQFDLLNLLEYVCHSVGPFEIQNVDFGLFKLTILRFPNFICLSASSPMFHVPKTTHPKPNSTYGAKTKRGMIKLKANGMKFFFLLQNCKKNSIQNIILSVAFQKYFEGKYLNFSHQAIKKLLLSSSFYDFYFYFQEFGGIHQVAEL